MIKLENFKVKEYGQDQRGSESKCECVRLFVSLEFVGDLRSQVIVPNNNVRFTNGHEYELVRFLLSKCEKLTRNKTKDCKNFGFVSFLI
jgi:hypothetical protein